VRHGAQADRVSGQRLGFSLDTTVDCARKGPGNVLSSSSIDRVACAVWGARARARGKRRMGGPWAALGGSSERVETPRGGQAHHSRGARHEWLPGQCGGVGVGAAWARGHAGAAGPLAALAHTLN